jgi:hypothetical protein
LPTILKNNHLIIIDLKITLFFLETSNAIKLLPRIPKAEDLSTLFDQQRQNIEANRGLAGGSFGAGGSLGFGFRGTIPKLPSFKVRDNFL